MIYSISAQDIGQRNLAVYTFDARGVSSIEAGAITDRIRLEVSKANVYVVIERGLMEEVLKEQAFQLTGACTESSCLVEVGNLLAVHYMIGGSVTHIGSLYSIEARIIDIETGDIVASVIEDYNGPVENLLVQTTKIVAAKLLGSETSITSGLFTGTSDLLVKSNPPGGTIYINDKPVGDVTPYRLEGLLEGNYTIKVRKDNLVGETAVSLVRNDRKEISVNLIKEQYILRIYSKPEGAEVTINYASIGKTPIDYTVTDTTIDYQIQLRKDLYFNVDETVHFSNSTMLRLNYHLEPYGRIEIPYPDNIEVFLNDKHIDRVSNMTIVGNALMNNRQCVIDQLGFSNYRIRIERENHQSFETTVTLTPDQPFKKIKHEFKRILSPYDEPPKPLSLIRPKYPKLAIEAGLVGIVIVHALIDENGRVIETSIIKETPWASLNESAVEAISKTRYKPAQFRGEPVGAWVRIPVNFKLE